MKSLKKLYLILLLNSLMIQQYKAQVVEAWIAIYDAGNGEIAKTMAIDDSGFIYVAGTRWDSSNNGDYIVIKYNPSGNIIWVTSYDGAVDSTDNATALAVDYLGNVYVTGGSYNGINMDYTTVKYNSNGLEQWAAKFNGNGNSTDIARSIAVDDSANVYVTGQSFNGSNYSFATIKYNSLGDTLWTALYNGGNNPKSISIDDSANIYICGSENIGGNTYFTTIKYNSNGVEQWVANYDTNGSGNYYLNDMVIDNNGNVYVTGSSFATIKYNTNGIIQWVAIYDGGSAYAIDIDDSGNVYVSGDASDSTNVFYATIKYNANGDTLWASTFIVDGAMPFFVRDLAIDNFYNVYVTGYSINWAGDTTDDYLTVKYNSNGVLLWAAYYNGKGTDWTFGDYAKIVVVDTFGNAYVTGFSFNGSNTDIVTIKYGDSLTCDSVNAAIFVPELKCNWDSITLLAGGGADYLWNPDSTLSDTTIANPIANPDTTTIYSVIVSNNCSSDTAQITIMFSPPLSDSLLYTNLKCNGSNDGTVKVLISGGTPPYNYLWSNAATTDSIGNLIAGIYSVTISDSLGCTASDSVTITQPDSIIIIAIVDTAKPGNNDGGINITVSGGNPPYFFSWDNGATSEDLDSIYAGSYSVTVTDSLGCIDSVNIVVPEITDINQSLIINAELKIYPNPNDGKFLIRYSIPDKQSAKFIIFDIIGSKLKTYQLEGGIKKLNIVNKALKNGLYFYQVIVNNRIILTDKLVIIK